MTRKMAKLLYYTLGVIGFVFMALGCVGYSRVWLYVGLGIMVLCTLINLKWNRCPHCGMRLGTWRKLSNCPSCGKELAG